jgi:hypothetical protein
VRSDGLVTITYVNVEVVNFLQQFQIRYVRCDPSRAPHSPACLPPVLVHNETQPLVFGGSLGAQDFHIATYPKHDHRVDANGIETYVVWDRCKVAPIFGIPCPDADVVMKASNNTGDAWFPGALAPVNISSNDQFFPWISTDRSRNIVNIVYYSSQNDVTFQHRVQVFLHRIIPGGTTPDPITNTHLVTSALNDPSGDLFEGGFFFGDSIGVSARGNGAEGGSRAWVHFTFNTRQGNYGGALAPNQDNRVARVNY